MNILDKRSKVNRTITHEHGGTIAVILVTGGTGFIGSHTVEALLHQRHDVRCVVRPHRKTLGWLADLPIKPLFLDLTDTSTLVRHLSDVEYVLHIGGVTKAKNRKEYFSGNVDTTRSLLDACTQSQTIRKFCFVSSLTAVGPSRDGTPLTEEDVCSPVTSYGESKLFAEKLVRESTLPTVILRPPAVYGPRDRDILEMFRWIKRGIVPTAGGSGKTLSMIHAVDLAAGIAAATFSESTSGKTYFISESTIHLFDDLLFSVAQLMNRTIHRIHVPSIVLHTIASVAELGARIGKTPAILNREKVRDLLQDHWVCSPAKLREDIGFETSIPIEEGLKATYGWYRNAGWI